MTLSRRKYNKKGVWTAQNGVNQNQGPFLNLERVLNQKTVPGLDQEL